MTNKVAEIRQTAAMDDAKRGAAAAGALPMTTRDASCAAMTTQFVTA